jgi:hypothetical protein
VSTNEKQGMTGGSLWRSGTLAPASPSVDPYAIPLAPGEEVVREVGS